MKTNRILCVVWVAALALVSGCSLFPRTVSDKSWSQVADQEQRQEELSSTPPGEWRAVPATYSGR